jgi:hypothetical protein
VSAGASSRIAHRVATADEEGERTGETKMKSGERNVAPTGSEPTTSTAPANHVRASIGDEPAFAYTCNDRLNLEKGILSVSLLLLVLTDMGNEDIDRRIVMGLGIALDQLADMSHGLYSRQDAEERPRAPISASKEEVEKLALRMRQSRGASEISGTDAT